MVSDTCVFEVEAELGLESRNGKQILNRRNHGWRHDVWNNGGRRRTRNEQQGRDKRLDKTRKLGARW